MKAVAYVTKAWSRNLRWLWLDQSAEHLRDRKFEVLSDLVVAHMGVCLALGETNNIRQITRSVICFNTGEQTLAPVMRAVCRPLKANFDAVQTHLFSSSSQNIKT